MIVSDNNQRALQGESQGGRATAAQPTYFDPLALVRYERKNAMNPLKALHHYGQSFWLDSIRHELIASGDLRCLIDLDGLKGVTSNPAIFEQAIRSSCDYQSFVKSLGQQGLNAKLIYEHVAVRDIRAAAHVLQSVYELSAGRDGYVSLEVSPHLAYDTQGTVREARRLWQTVGYPNVMIKVPATLEGLPAMEQLISEGINVNATLLFSRARYEQVATAYMSGLEKLAARGGDVAEVASVASFFISRIDAQLDSLTAARLKQTRRPSEKALLQSIQGKAAIANAKLAYQRYKQLFSSARWRALASKGARTQRLLWASTGVKNPACRDVRYVEELIGPDTVNTMPPAVVDAFREHGLLRLSLEEDLDGARRTMVILAQLDISIEEMADRLLKNGVKLFEAAFDALLYSVARRCRTQLSA